jgi:hypothetical protein
MDDCKEDKEMEVEVTCKARKLISRKYTTTCSSFLSKIVCFSFQCVHVMHWLLHGYSDDRDVHVTLSLGPVVIVVELLLAIHLDDLSSLLLEHSRLDLGFVLLQLVCFPSLFPTAL